MTKQLDGGEAFRWCGEVAEAEFVSAGRHLPLDGRGTFRFADSDRDRRMADPELADHRSDRIDDQRRERNDVQPPDVEVEDRTGDGVEIGDVAQHAACRVDGLLACGCQLRGSAESGEELGTQAALECADAVGQRGLGDMEIQGGLGETALVGDRSYVLEVSQANSSR